MKSKINQKKAGVMLSYTSEIIKIATGLVYTPIMLRLLGKSEYGLYQLVYSVVSYLSLLSLGFGSSYIRFYSKRKVDKDDEGIAKLNGLFLMVFSIMSFVAIICGFFMIQNSYAIFGNKLSNAENNKAKILMALLILNLAITFPDSIYNCVITANEQFLFQKGLLVIQNLASPLLTLPLLIAGVGSVGMVSVTTTLTIGIFLVHIIYCHRKLNIKFNFSNPDFKLLGSLGKFTFFIFLNQIIDQINWSVDKFVLGRVAGTTAIGIYGVGAQLNTLYVQLSTSISNVFVPQVNKIVAESDDNEELTRVFTKVGRIQFILLALILTGLIFFGKAFIPMWAGKGYTDSYMVMVLLIVPVTVPLIQNIGIEIQRAKNKHQVRSVVYFFIAISNIFISIPLAREFGPAGAAFGTFITMIIGNVFFMNWYYQHGIGINIVYFWHQILGISKGLIIPIIIGVLIYNFIPIYNVYIFLFAVLVYTVCYIFSLWLFGMNDYEKNLIVSIFMRKKNSEY